MKTIFIILTLFALIQIVAAQNDSSKVEVLSWKYNATGGKQEICPIDTSLDWFQNYILTRKKTISTTNLGNPGLAAIPNIYIHRIDAPLFHFYPFMIYCYTPDDNTYFNTNRQYTHISYFTNGNKTTSEQGIDMIHIQNISNYLNLGFKYHLIASAGQIRNQESKNNSLSFFSSYQKGRISIHACYNYNTFKEFDNGGIISDSTFDTIASYQTSAFYVNLENARSKYRNTNLSVCMDYKFGRKLKKYINDSIFYEKILAKAGINYSILINRFRKVYTDDSTGFYSDYFIYSPEIYDSTQYNSATNRLQFYRYQDSSATYLPQISLSALNELTEYRCYEFDTTLISNGLNADFVFEKSRFNTRLMGEYYFHGFRQGDINICLDIKKTIGSDSLSFLSLNASFNRQKPWYPLQRYYSTNFCWDTSFISMDKTNILLSYSKIKHHFETGVVYTILDNFISFDNAAMPVQNTSTFNIITVYIKKDILFHGLVFRNMVYYQQSGNNALPLPEWCAYNSTFYNFHVFNMMLHVQLGFDIYYNTSFHAQAYMPATSVFYLQEEKEIGGYPYADVFLNANLKRVRFFLKMEHVNHELMGRYYFGTIHYPVQGRMLKFGLSWSFYD